MIRTTLRHALGLGLVLAWALSWTQAAHAFAGRTFATGLSAPVYLTSPPGDRRVFVVEKGGRVLAVTPQSQQVYFDLSSIVTTGGEQGLLGLAFDPRFSTNFRMYVYYSDAATRQSVVARLTASSARARTVDVGTLQPLLRVSQPDYNNHKAGWIGFRPGDPRNLYVALGDGGSGNDPQNNGQTRSTLLGKMLRINVDTTDASYTIPADNPFVGDPNTRGEIWALGLRNPWRNSFDRRTGAFWITDVGQDSREEIDFEPAGSAGGFNYGWRLREGTIPTPGVGGDAPGLTGPVFEYPHLGSQGSLGNSITGGYVYRGPSIADADGRYFFGDFVSDRVFSSSFSAGGSLLDVRDDTAALIGASGLSGIASFGEDSRGRLYVIGIDGTVVVMCATPGPASPGANPCR
jgi:glucose/arabinose dehydrogenase